MNRHSKLHKAQILAKTVKCIQQLQRQQSAIPKAADPNTVTNFQAGFAVCTKEIEKFHELEPVVKSRLVQHLSNHFTDINTGYHTQPQIEPMQLRIPPSLPGSPSEHTQEQQILQWTPSNGCYVKLPNGILTYVVPQQMQHIPQVVIPTRISSVASMQSEFERLSFSPTNSNDFMNYQTTPTFNHRPNTMLLQQHSLMPTHFIYPNDPLVQDRCHWF